MIGQGLCSYHCRAISRYSQQNRDPDHEEKNQQEKKKNVAGYLWVVAFNAMRLKTTDAVNSNSIHMMHGQRRNATIWSPRHFLRSVPLPSNLK